MGVFEDDPIPSPICSRCSGSAHKQDGKDFCDRCIAWLKNESDDDPKVRVKTIIDIPREHA